MYHRINGYHWTTQVLKNVYSVRSLHCSWWNVSFVCINQIQTKQTRIILLQITTYTSYYYYSRILYIHVYLLRLQYTSRIVITYRVSFVQCRKCSRMYFPLLLAYPISFFLLLSFLLLVLISAPPLLFLLLECTLNLQILQLIHYRF